MCSGGVKETARSRTVAWRSALPLSTVGGEAGLRGSTGSRSEGGGYFGVASPPVCQGKLFNQPASKEGAATPMVATPVPPASGHLHQRCSRRHIGKYTQPLDTL